MNQTVTENHRLRDTIIIGAGLTGLTTAYCLTRKGCDIEVIEQSPCVGGQIRTYHENGFTFESGPNTGVISHPEVAELLAELSPTCRLERPVKRPGNALYGKEIAFILSPQDCSVQSPPHYSVQKINSIYWVNPSVQKETIPMKRLVNWYSGAWVSLIYIMQ